MFAKCISVLVLCSMMIGFSHQQVVVPTYSAAYYPTAYVYSPYLTAAAYPSVLVYGSNKNKASAGEENAPAQSLVNNKP
ncbi:unnamed protein product [Caenorhabditis nigoni]|uniref:Nematode cuticle collagen N-terminal domain-containing protein n=1 Tax=Caenorhabditis nigoni TaxID=1611254 RepID=A0A2G5UZ39_9PELO|nr:hypothetical protein B9Z55_005041 [Caenorhabditis nigoni]